MFTGAQIGTVVAMTVSGVLCQFLGWESAFYVFGEPCLFYAVDLILQCDAVQANSCYRNCVRLLHSYVVLGYLGQKWTQHNALVNSLHQM